MADIKIKKKNKEIKKLDKTSLIFDKTKDSIVQVKEKLNNNEPKDEDVYNSKTILNTSSEMVRRPVNVVRKRGAKDLKVTIDNVKKGQSKVKQLIRSYKDNKIKKNIKNKTKKDIKLAGKTIKTSKKVAKETIKTSQRAIKIARETAKKAYQTIKVAVKATVTTIKALIAGLKAFIAFLVAGGWIVLVIIVVLCLIGLLCGSIYGIFFSSEKYSNESITMSTVVRELNNELTLKIEEIKNQNTYDEVIINSNRADWKHILALYSIKTVNEKNKEVVTIDEEKINDIKNIFWDIHTIEYEIKDEEIDEDMTGKTGPPQKIQKKVLHININSKSLDEIKVLYNLTENQIKQLDEILDSKYASMWAAVINGTFAGSTDIVEIALSQLGNVGGEPYWSWYGFPSRVEWCATFVSWVANQAGYIDSGVIPKFAACRNGVEWFKAMGEWQNKGYIPKSGDIIFFDWEVDGIVNHVGIVERVDNNTVYTVEGNSNDECRERSYNINDNIIFGYGTPSY